MRLLLSRQIALGHRDLVVAGRQANLNVAALFVGLRGELLAGAVLVFDEHLGAVDRLVVLVDDLALELAGLGVRRNRGKCEADRNGADHQAAADRCAYHGSLQVREVS